MWINIISTKEQIYEHKAHHCEVISDMSEQMVKDPILKLVLFVQNLFASDAKSYCYRNALLNYHPLKYNIITGSAPAHLIPSNRMLSVSHYQEFYS